MDIVPSSFQVTNLIYAQDKYDDFVDIYQPIMTVLEFQKRRNLPLSEQCASIFYSKTAHLTDNDFFEIDRSILQLIGFKNSFSEKTGKNGMLKLQDMRNDFSNAIRCLRNTVGFIEGTSLDDSNAHFVIQRTIAQGTTKNGGKNKQSLWIRMRALEHFVIMANTCNSFLIREYFLDLKRIMTEYNMYQTVYRAKYELRTKDSTIGELRKDIHRLIEKTDIQTEQMNIQSQKLEMLSNILMKETDNKVIDVEKKEKKQELVVLRDKNAPTQIEVLRGQMNHVNYQLKWKINDMKVIGNINT